MARPKEMNIDRYLLKTARRLCWNDPRKILLYPVIRKIAPFTMLGYAGLCQMVDAIDEMENKKLEGAVVEMGCWRGGCGALMAWRVKQHGSKRKVWLFDSFEGLPAFGKEEKEHAAIKGVVVVESDKTDEMLHPSGVMVASEKDVDTLSSMLGIGDYLCVVKGWFQNTVPQLKEKIDKIAILRLDADLYMSTKYCLNELYDSVVKGGIIVFDDFDGWVGCRQAFYEFCFERKIYPNLQQYSGGKTFFRKN